jgi:alpha-tubulin suppressor-like RCC1 family protein
VSYRRNCSKGKKQFSEDADFEVFQSLFSVLKDGFRILLGGWDQGRVRSLAWFCLVGVLGFGWIGCGGRESGGGSTADTTPPETTIESGPSSSTTSTVARFTFSCNESGCSFECKLDGTNWEACTSPKDYSGLVGGSHIFEVRARDKAGNTDPSPASWFWQVVLTGGGSGSGGSTTSGSTSGGSTSGSTSGGSTTSGSTSGGSTTSGSTSGGSTTSGSTSGGSSSGGSEDTTPPDTVIQSAPSNPTSSTTAIFTFGCSEPGCTFQCRLDGGVWEFCSSPKGYSGLQDGAHVFSVRALDLAGNMDPTPAVWNWEVHTGGGGSGGSTSGGSSSGGGTGSGVGLGWRVVSSGWYHTCGIWSTGQLYCWGYNYYGQLGSTVSGNQNVPVLVAGSFSDWVSVSAGGRHTCALRSTGQLYCWGYNLYGQLGDGTTTDRSTPVLVSGGITDWVAVSSGGYHTCGLRRTGEVYCWGWNDSGQLGDGSGVWFRTTPGRIGGGFNDWVALSAGGYHACAIRSTRVLYCWGDNYYGQLGDGTTTNRFTPTVVFGGFTDWITVSSGGYHTCALRSTKALYCWGGNFLGQLGDGTTTQRIIPVAVSGGFTDWVTVSAGGYHTCGLRGGGILSCWGKNLFGQLGDGTDINRLIPYPVSGGFTDWVIVSSGGEHTCALRVTGELFCWGGDDYGQLGDGSPGGFRTTPILVSGGYYTWRIVSSGDTHTCAIRSNGALYCWGSNGAGQLGDGTNQDRSFPVLVPVGFTDWVSVSAGYAHTCAVRGTGQIYCWGSNSYGQLGDGTATNRLTPTLVSGGFTDWVAVSAGRYHTCALRSNGQIYCWGANFVGQLGDGTATNRSTPTLVSGGFTDWVAVFAGGSHTCGVRSAGSLYCWGDNSYGKLGDGTTTNRTVPTLVFGGFSDWRKVSAGSDHTCAIRGSGIAYCWGGNSWGQLGNGSSSNATAPVLVYGDIIDWTQIASGSTYTCAIRGSGELYCWGENNSGQLGDGTVTSRPIPFIVSGGFTDWRSVSSGGSHTCAIRGSDRLYCWGSNARGQLGELDPRTPHRVVGP